MKYTKHILFGAAVGLLQYILITGFSYLSVISNLSLTLETVLMICSHALILFVAGWNVFYKVRSFAALFMRVLASIGAYVLIWAACVYFAVITNIEKWLGIGSNSQNAQGLIALMFYISLAFIGIIMIVIKCIVIKQDNQT